MYSFPNLEPVHFFMSSSNCCFLTCIHISQEAGKVVWYSHFFKNFPQFVVIHTVKGFSVVNETEMFFWNSLAFSIIQKMLAIWSRVPLPFLNPALTSVRFSAHMLLKTSLGNFEHCFAIVWDEPNCVVVGTFFGLLLINSRIIILHRVLLKTVWESEKEALGITFAAYRRMPGEKKCSVRTS